MLPRSRHYSVIARITLHPRIPDSSDFSDLKCSYLHFDFAFVSVDAADVHHIGISQLFHASDCLSAS